MSDVSRLPYLLLIALGTVGVVSAGCEGQNVVCTAEFVTHSVKVLSPDGQPADSVAVHVRNARTGADYDVCGDLSICDHSGDRRYGEKGSYVIFHDGLDATPFGSHVVVTGRKDGLSFRADYIFRRGECHVQKERGPEEVMLTK